MSGRSPFRSSQSTWEHLRNTYGISFAFMSSKLMNSNYFWMTKTLIFILLSNTEEDVWILDSVVDIYSYILCIPFAVQILRFRLRRNVPNPCHMTRPQSNDFSHKTSHDKWIYYSRGCFMCDSVRIVWEFWFSFGLFFPVVRFAYPFPSSSPQNRFFSALSLSFSAVRGEQYRWPR